MNTPNNIELHSYETLFTSLAWIQGSIITWMYATGTCLLYTSDAADE